MTQTATEGITIAFVNETFTGDVSTATAVPVAATERMHILAWSLTVTGNSAVCPIQIKTSGGVVYAADRIPAIAASGVGAQVRGVFKSEPGMILPSLPAGEELVIGGGGTAAVLDGTVTYIIRSIA